MAQVKPSLCYGKYNNSVHNHMFNGVSLADVKDISQNSDAIICYCHVQ